MTAASASEKQIECYRRMSGEQRLGYPTHIAKVHPPLLLTGDLSVLASGTPQSRGARKLVSAQ
jgi:hypothetical protein